MTCLIVRENGDTLTQAETRRGIEEVEDWMVHHLTNRGFKVEPQGDHQFEVARKKGRRLVREILTVKEVK